MIAMLGDVLVRHRLDERGPAERERALVRDHRHEVGEARDIRGAGGAGADHRGDLRHHAAHHDLLAEQMAARREQADHVRIAIRLRIDARAGRVDQPHDRHPAAQRELADARHLGLAREPHRAALDREVVRGGGDGPAVDLAPAAHDGIGRDVVRTRPHLGAVDAELDERATVEQQRHPLARGQLAALVVLRDLGLAAHLAGLRAPRFEVRDALAHRRHQKFPPPFGHSSARASATVATSRPASRTIFATASTSSPFDVAISPSGK